MFAVEPPLRDHTAAKVGLCGSAYCVVRRTRELFTLRVGEIPEFGVAKPGVTYRLRPGGYAVIFNDAGHVAVSATPSGCHLPGGGKEGDEAPEETTIREVQEECGLDVRIKIRLGTADELIYSPRETVYFRKRGTFFLAEVVRIGVGCEQDHQLVWLATDRAIAKLVHESHRWAVSMAWRVTGRR